MIFLDANIIIYAASPENQRIRQLISEESDTLACSEMVKLEVLGFPTLSRTEKLIIKDFLSSLVSVPINSKIIDMAITIRQQKTIKSPDAIIVATVLVHKAELWTNNTRDFKDIKNLRLYNPLKEGR